MKRLIGKTVLALAVTLLAAVPSWSQAPWAAAAKAVKTRQYNLGTKETLSGKVIEVEHLAPERAARLSRVHLLLEANGEKLVVQLGPASWLAQHNFTLAPGDFITVTGSRVNRPGETYFLAGEVKNGDQVLPLRDEKGWSLWGRARRQP
jgi:hypothetical protein